MNTIIYTIGSLNPIKREDIEGIEKLSPVILPDDYVGFLTKYGFGNINELLMIQNPDPEYVKSNFEDYMDFWELKDDEITSALNSLTIATTIDGDIVLVIDNKETPILILPRHSEEPIRFTNFEKVIEYYKDTYGLNNDLYFDPIYDFGNEYISFVKDGQLDKKSFEHVYQMFLNQIPFDKLYNAESQPKYIIQKIGGWVYFDSIGKSAIRIKYQKQFKEEADKILDFINDQINKSRKN